MSEIFRVHGKTKRAREKLKDGCQVRTLVRIRRKYSTSGTCGSLSVMAVLEDHMFRKVTSGTRGNPNLKSKERNWRNRILSGSTRELYPQFTIPKRLRELANYHEKRQSKISLMAKAWSLKTWRLHVSTFNKKNYKEAGACVHTLFPKHFGNLRIIVNFINIGKTETVEVKKNRYR